MKWEYLTVDKTLDNNQMNELGDAGWELVAVVSPAHFVFHYFFIISSKEKLSRCSNSQTTETLHACGPLAIQMVPGSRETTAIRPRNRCANP